MANWLITCYAITGDEQEVKTVYDLLKGLEGGENTTDDGTWLGCLVEALGGDPGKVYCRGTYYDVKRFDDHIELMTETASTTCHGVFRLLGEEYPSLECCYFVEEPNLGLYATNDDEGRFFPERVVMTIYTEETDLNILMFNSMEDAYRWLSTTFGRDVKDMDDVKRLYEDGIADVDFDEVSVE